MILSSTRARAVCTAVGVAFLIVALPAQAPPTPSDVARALIASGKVVDVPVKGQVRQEIEKDAPTFATPMGETTAMLLRFPPYTAPYLMTISSFLRGLGNNLHMYVPSGVSFDENFQPLSHFDETNLRPFKDRLIVDLMWGDKFSAARYMLLFTHGNQVKEVLGTRTSSATSGNLLTAMVGNALGFGKIHRSLDATIYVATAPPEPSSIAKKLGGPWLRVEGANQATLRKQIGEPTSVSQERNTTIWIYDKTAAGKVKVFIIDDVASLKPPK